MTPAEERIRAACDTLADALIAALAEARPSDAPPALMSVSQAAARASVGRTFIYSEIGAGRLRSHRLGRRRVIAEVDLMQWLEGAAGT